jgi:hypothetical protein
MLELLNMKEGFHEDSLKKTTLLIELQTDVQGRKP